MGIVHEMLNCRVALLRRHATFKPTDLAISHGKIWRMDALLTLKPARCKRNAIKSKNETNWEL